MGLCALPCTCCDIVFWAFHRFVTKSDTMRKPLEVTLIVMAWLLCNHPTPVATDSQIKALRHNHRLYRSPHENTPLTTSDPHGGVPMGISNSLCDDAEVNYSLLHLNVQETWSVCYINVCQTQRHFKLAIEELNLPCCVNTTPQDKPQGTFINI